MKIITLDKIKIMVTIFFVTIFFSCESDLRKVQQLSETSFMPSGEADSINLKYTDSGKIKSILVSPKMLDYSNITNAFTEFPKGIHVTLLDERGNKSITRTTNIYCLFWWWWWIINVVIHSTFHTKCNNHFI